MDLILENQEQNSDFSEKKTISPEDNQSLNSNYSDNEEDIDDSTLIGSKKNIQLDTEESDDGKGEIIDNVTRSLKKNLFSMNMPTHVKFFLIFSAIYFIIQIFISLLGLSLNLVFVVN